ncbi:DUF1016 N-terminal domain-containing protein [Vibrio sp. S11_S32]|uniref:DUF1016 N-terminal domain-containing protein n=1 Tax=Vibrio sp. S11_S32 TaxID=2720225 RepID=UPI0019346E4F|nr:DUF1016 N-terminal domain-containing protein [Vibrio sp. S11_S32]
MDYRVRKTYEADRTAIVEGEQNGNEKARYGSYLVKTLSQKLTRDFGSGFSQRNIKYFRQFYLAFPELQIGHTVSAQLSWSHYKQLLRVQDPQARTYYAKEAYQQNWSTRTLDRHISTQYYQRLLSTPSI